MVELQTHLAIVVHIDTYIIMALGWQGSIIYPQLGISPQNLCWFQYSLGISVTQPVGMQYDRSLYVSFTISEVILTIP